MDRRHFIAAALPAAAVGVMPAFAEPAREDYLTLGKNPALAGLQLSLSGRDSATTVADLVLRQSTFQLVNNHVVGIRALSTRWTIADPNGEIFAFPLFHYSKPGRSVRTPKSRQMGLGRPALSGRQVIHEANGTGLISPFSLASLAKYKTRSLATWQRMFSRDQMRNLVFDLIAGGGVVKASIGFALFADGTIQGSDPDRLLLRIGNERNAQIDSARQLLMRIRRGDSEKSLHAYLAAINKVPVEPADTVRSWYYAARRQAHRKLASRLRNADRDQFLSGLNYTSQLSRASAVSQPYQKRA